jgi:hypothetical protein
MLYVGSSSVAGTFSSNSFVANRNIESERLLNAMEQRNFVVGCLDRTNY